MATPTNLVELGFQPDPLNTKPIYAQLAAALSEAIRAGRITLGKRLPSERLYARALGVSRTTITAAYQELKAMGLLRGYVGRGAVVIADDPDRASTGAIRWSQFGSRLGRAVQPRSVAGDRAQISFGDGWVHSSLIPSATLTTCAARALRDPAVFSKAAALLGLPALREALVESLRSNGIHATLGEILITGGAQQGLNTVARALISPGDAVICESPSWHGAAQAFRAAGAEVAGVAMDHEGVDPEALEDSIIRWRPKFVYLIPTFQCPTGRLLGLQRRHRVLDICARYRTPIVESHVYGDISFGDKLPSLKSLDSGGLVIHQGSASKIISAALRVGWLVAPRAAVDLLAPAKASLDLSTPALSQAVLAGFLNSGAYARHQSKFRDELRVRRDALIGALAAHCPQLRYVVPQGGLYVWAQLPKRIQAHEFEAAAAAEGVSVRGGHHFLADGGESSHVRLCFAAPSLDQIDVGAQRLGKVLLHMLHGQPETVGGSSTWAQV
jgi:DNA-binding transcriptional MocR family regulator